MRKVVSVSLGSPFGDFRQVLELGKQSIEVSRVGTGGRAAAVRQILHDLDGRVDVLCLGGVNLHYMVADRAYPLPLGRSLAAVVKHSPVVDGSWVKRYWEPWVVRKLASENQLSIRGRRVLLVSALDRWALAEAFHGLGCSLTIGDAMFGLGLPFAFHDLKLFQTAAAITLPVLRFLPLSWLYPLGKSQDKVRPRFARWYGQAEIIAGDFHFIYRHLPEDLSGKTIITATVRSDHVQSLRSRGLATLVTTGPQLNGRAWGANVLEGVLRAYWGRDLKDTEPEAVWELLSKIQAGPLVLHLNP